MKNQYSYNYTVLRYAHVVTNGEETIVLEQDAFGLAVRIAGEVAEHERNG